MCPAFTHPDSLRPSFVTVPPNCCARPPSAFSTRPTCLRFMSASSSSKECSAIPFAPRATFEPLKSPDGDRPWPPLLSFYALTDSTHIRQEHFDPESIQLDPESRRRAPRHAGTLGAIY